MTAESLEELRGELARLCRGARLQIAQALREARSFGEGSNNEAVPGAAVIGSTVSVEDLPPM
jgi:transcription elongation GreA/GreB family factor